MAECNFVPDLLIRKNYGMPNRATAAIAVLLMSETSFHIIPVFWPTDKVYQVSSCQSKQFKYKNNYAANTPHYY